MSQGAHLLEGVGSGPGLGGLAERSVGLSFTVSLVGFLGWGSRCPGKVIYCVGRHSLLRTPSSPPCPIYLRYWGGTLRALVKMQMFSGQKNMLNHD